MSTASITAQEVDALASYRDWLALQDMSTSTIDQRCKFMASRFTHWGTLDQPAAFLVQWLRQYDGWTRRTYQGHLDSIYAFLVDQGALVESPISRLRAAPSPDARPSPLSPEQLEAVLTSARGDLRAWMLLAYLAGLRCFEIAKFRGEDINSTMLFVHGKGGRQAEVPTHPDLWALAQTYPRVGAWFPSPQAKRAYICDSTIAQQVRRHFRAHGIEKGSIHRLRHSCLTDLSRNSVGVRVIQEIGRHKSLATTQRYIEVTSTERAEGVRTLHVSPVASPPEPGLATVHHLAQHWSWCASHQVADDLEWCSHELLSGSIRVEIVAGADEAPSIGAAASRSRYIEGLTPAEADQLAIGLHKAARIARGEQ